MANAKDFILIQSEVTIKVTCGLQYLNFTKKDSDIKDRMKVAPIWPKASFTLMKGTYAYPTEVTKWNSILRLKELRKCTFGEYVDFDTLPENDKKRVAEIKKNIDSVKQRMKKETKAPKDEDEKE